VQKKIAAKKRVSSVFECSPASVIKFTLWKKCSFGASLLIRIIHMYHIWSQAMPVKFRYLSLARTCAIRSGSRSQINYSKLKKPS
jgi:hypothetical protein